MNRLMILNSLLTVHVTGLVLMAGTTVVDYSAFKTFWKLVDGGEGHSPGLLRATAAFSRLGGIGAALLVVTGVGMMALTNGVFGEQLWFRIKFGLVVVLILNALLIGRRQGNRLRGAFGGDTVADAVVRTTGVRVALNRFFLIQLVLFLAIISLSIFKFN